MESLRLITLAVESLRRAGVERPADRIALVRTPQTVTILIKNGDFTAEEIAHLADWARSGGLSMLHPLASDAGLAPADRAHRALARGEPIADEVPLNLEPPTDDRPFFFSLFTFRQASEGRFRVAWSFVLQHGRALALLLGLLRVTLVAVVLFVLAPLLIRRRDEAGSGPPLRTRLGSSLYFAALGFGFLLVEIPLIQQLILFLGHPVYSVTVVLFAMLVASGTGSLLAGRLAELGRLRPRLALLAAVVVLLGFNWLGPDLLRSLVGLALPLRIAIAVTAILPIGLLLGVPFPSGIRALHRTAPALVPWAWAINGAASVAAPAVAMLVAISSGFSTTLYLGAGAYVAAALLLPLIDRPAAAPVASLG
jgi:hypothetical protein